MSKQVTGTLVNLFGETVYNSIRALTWKPPFLTLMAVAEKIETRNWYCEPPGRILMCNGATGYSDDVIKEMCTPAQIEKIKEYLKNDPFKELKGHAVAVGVFYKCRRMRPEDEEKAFVKYSPQLWCHLYKDIQLIQPFEHKGNQKWSIVDDQKILANLKYK